MVYSATLEEVVAMIEIYRYIEIYNYFIKTL